MPTSVKSIGKSAFSQCTLLSEVSIPPSIITINEYAFNECISLLQITIPPSVAKIECDAFSNCDQLSDVKSSSSRVSIDKNAFRFCYNLPHLWRNKNSNDNGYAIMAAAIIAVLTSFVFVLVEFIITCVWWSRIHPWFAHGYKTGKAAYVSLEISWISSLLSFLPIFGFIIILVKLVKGTYNLSSNFFIVLFSSYVFLSFIAAVSGIVASVFALKKNKIDGESVKCLKYVFDGYQGAFDWAAKQSLDKQNKLNEWYINMIDRAYNKKGNVKKFF